MNTETDHPDIALELSYLNVIKISGRDAITFLNDQFTNDITALEPGHWQYNGYCTSKGRLIALMRLFVDADNVYIVLPATLSQVIIKRLLVYVFRAKVNFERLDNHRIYFTSGDKAKSMIDTLRPQQLSVVDDGYVLNLSAHHQRCLVIDNSSESLPDSNNPTRLSAEQLWRLSEIREGIPNIDIQTSEQFVPQHVHVDQLNGISFSKGCFPGQEVVARLHYLGKAKQSMQHIVIESNDSIEPGQTLNHPDYKKALKVVDAVNTQKQTFECLAVGQFS